MAAVAFAAYAWAVFVLLAVLVIVLLPLLPRMRWRWRVARGAVRLLASLTATRVPSTVSTVCPTGPRWSWPTIRAGWMGLRSRRRCPHVRRVAAEVLQHEGLIGFVFKALGTEFVERYEREHGVADADRVVTHVRGGRSLLIFPEGHLARAPGFVVEAGDLVSR